MESSEGHASITPLSRSDLNSRLERHGGVDQMLSGQVTRNEENSVLLGGIP